MDKISNAIKCVNCLEVLSTPVLLPCGHSICKKHTETNNHQIICAQCGMYHPNKGFIVQTALSEIISSQIGSMDFGEEHNEAKRSCERLRDVLSQVDQVLQDPVYYIHETIVALKNQVYVKGEMLKSKLDDYIETLLDILQQYENRCRTKSVEHVKIAHGISHSSAIAKEKLNTWTDSLNKLVFDEPEWKTIRATCDREHTELYSQLKCFTQLLLLREFEEKANEVHLFEKINIDSLFQV